MTEPVPGRRAVLRAAAGAATAMALAPAGLSEPPAFTPERFGARGDGRTDDSDAFARLSDAVNAAGGGVVALRRTIYLVGTQRRAPDGGWTVARLLAFENCRLPVAVHGNGATLRCAPGQRYGMFAPDGTALPGITKSSDGMARPYAAMIEAQGCSGGVLIENVELDGNSGALVIGGKRGDKGWQIGCEGVALRNNPGPERLVNVHAHHQPHDGFYVDGPRDPTPGVARLISGCRADMNGRQGMSLVGGQGYRIERSSFTRTARGQVVSAPAAGVDIEAERKKPVRDIAFTDCRFADNYGCGLVADSGDSADVTFTRCTFVGTDNWAAWPNKPGYRFAGCTFVGSVVHVFADPDPARAARFTDCLFTDDPALSPTGKLLLRKSAASFFGEGVLLERCRFVMAHGGALPAGDGATFRDCALSQSSPKHVAMRAVLDGRTTVRGPVDLSGSAILGTVTLNGAAVPHRTREQAEAARPVRAKGQGPDS